MGAQNWMDFWDLLLPPFYLIIIYGIAYRIKNKNLLKNKTYYKYLIPGLTCKLIGGAGVCILYTFYYTEGGDSTNYFNSSVTFVNILFNDGLSAFSDLLDITSTNIFEIGNFNENNGYWYFGANDPNAHLTVLLTTPIVLVSFKSYIVSTLILASLSFICTWKLFELFIINFPESPGNFAVAILFIPSVFFWGSAILKDTYALSALCLYLYTFYRFFIEKKRTIKYLVVILISVFLIIAIKPYIFFALLPGSLIWVNFVQVTRIKNPLIKILIIPFIVLFFGISVLFLITYFGKYLGEYSVENILNKATKTQQDLIRSQYGSNNYDIGKFDPTVQGVLSKAPAALGLALFRPFLWDVRNPAMLLSAIENTMTIIFLFYILIKVKFSTVIKSIFSNPLLVFCLLFSIFFAFSVGLTTANYGALSRLKIPLVPFYIASLFILYELNKKSFEK